MMDGAPATVWLKRHVIGDANDGFAYELSHELLGLFLPSINMASYSPSTFGQFA